MGLLYARSCCATLDSWHTNKPEALIKAIIYSEIFTAFIYLRKLAFLSVPHEPVFRLGVEHELFFQSLDNVLHGTCNEVK